MTDLPANHANVRNRIEAACLRSGRDPGDIRLIWVSKNHPRDKVLEALALGARHFGENRVQEMLEKFPLPPDQIPPEPGTGAPRDYQVHFIGRLQKNKIRKVLPVAAFIHSIDSAELLEAVDRVAGELGIVRDVFLQVNTSREAAKGGFPPESLLSALPGLPSSPHLRLVGLMTMGPLEGGPEAARAAFRELAGLLKDIGREAAAGPADGRLRDMRWLSMGMTGDFEVAVEEGAHFLRVGTGLFGTRR